MDDAIPWRDHLLRGGAVLVIVLGLQLVTRGSVTLPIAIAVAVGYVLVKELVRRYQGTD